MITINNLVGALIQEIFQDNTAQDMYADEYTLDNLFIHLMFVSNKTIETIIEDIIGHEDFNAEAAERTLRDWCLKLDAEQLYESIERDLDRQERLHFLGYSDN